MANTENTHHISEEDYENLKERLLNEVVGKIVDHKEVLYYRYPNDQNKGDFLVVTRSHAYFRESQEDPLKVINYRELRDFTKLETSTKSDETTIHFLNNQTLTIPTHDINHKTSDKQVLMNYLFTSNA